MRSALAIGSLVLGLAMITFFFRTRPAPLVTPPAEPAAIDLVHGGDLAGVILAEAPIVATPDAAISPRTVLHGDERETVEVTLVALAAGDRATFAAQFMPAVRAKIDDATFDACRTRVRQVAVHPDWETAENATVDGHAVRRVSMFGKSLTGFHSQGARWLADALWCVPVGLP